MKEFITQVFALTKRVVRLKLQQPVRLFFELAWPGILSFALKIIHDEISNRAAIINLWKNREAFDYFMLMLLANAAFDPLCRFVLHHLVADRVSGKYAQLLKHGATRTTYMLSFLIVQALQCLLTANNYAYFFHRIQADRNLYLLQKTLFFGGLHFVAFAICISQMFSKPSTATEVGLRLMFVPFTMCLYLMRVHIYAQIDQEDFLRWGQVLPQFPLMMQALNYMDSTGSAHRVGISSEESFLATFIAIPLLLMIFLHFPSEDPQTVPLPKESQLEKIQETGEVLALIKKGNQVTPQVLFEELSVVQHLGMAVQIKGSSPEDIDKLLDVASLEALKYYKLENLTEGEKRRLYIAMSSITKDFRLIVNEPLRGLPHDEFKQVVHLVKHLTEKQDVVVLVADCMQARLFSSKDYCIKQVGAKKALIIDDDYVPMCSKHNLTIRVIFSPRAQSDAEFARLVPKIEQFMSKDTWPVTKSRLSTELRLVFELSGSQHLEGILDQAEIYFSNLKIQVDTLVFNEPFEFQEGDKDAKIIAAQIDNYKQIRPNASPLSVLATLLSHTIRLKGPRLLFRPLMLLLFIQSVLYIILFFFCGTTVNLDETLEATFIALRIFLPFTLLYVLGATSDIFVPDPGCYKMALDHEVSSAAFYVIQMVADCLLCFFFVLIISSTLVLIDLQLLEGHAVEFTLIALSYCPTFISVNYLFHALSGGTTPQLSKFLLTAMHMIPVILYYTNIVKDSHIRSPVFWASQEEMIYMLPGYGFFLTNMNISLLTFTFLDPYEYMHRTGILWEECCKLHLSQAVVISFITIIWTMLRRAAIRDQISALLTTSNKSQQQQISLQSIGAAVGQVVALVGPDLKQQHEYLRQLVENQQGGAVEKPGTNFNLSPLQKKFTLRQIMNIFGRLHGLTEQQISNNQMLLLSAFELTEKVNSQVESLTAQETHRFEALIGMIVPKKTLILEDPFKDLQSNKVLAKIILALEETTIVLSTSKLNLAQKMCNHLFVAKSDPANHIVQLRFDQDPEYRVSIWHPNREVQCMKDQLRATRIYYKTTVSLSYSEFIVNQVPASKLKRELKKARSGSLIMDFQIYQVSMADKIAAAIDTASNKVE